MDDAAPPRGPAAPHTPRHLLFWMAGRIATATVLLGGTLALSLSAGRDIHSTTPIVLITLIVVTYLTACALGVVLLKGRSPEPAVAMLLACDVASITALVYVTGGAGSVFTILYGAPILMSAIADGPRAARLSALASGVSYAVVALGMGRGLLPPPSDQSSAPYQLSSSEFAYSMISNVVGLFVVALLAGELATRLRHAGGALARAERDAAGLSRLNEDIVRSISSGLVTADLDGFIRTTNPAATEMFGGTRTALEGSSLGRLLPLPDAPISSIRYPIRGHGDARRLDGTSFPVGYTISSLLDEAGHMQGVLVAFQDLTQIHRLEDAARRAEQLAQLGRLSAGLAHEIRNPLSSISGSVELVCESPKLDAEERRLLGIVISEAARLDDLVSTMLNVARPSMPRPVEFDLRTTITDVCSVADGGMAAKAGVRLGRDLPDAPVLTNADPGQMRQVAWNLLKNALQASPSETMIILRVGLADETTAFMEVLDEGAGIEPAAEEKLFDMFYTGRTHGIGLGLALVKQIVDAHEGRIVAKNRESRGACFRVELPVRGPSVERSSSP